MSLKYTWILDPIKGNESMRPRTVAQKRVPLSTLAYAMTAGGGPDQAMITLVLNRFVAALKSELQSGSAVSTPLGVFSLGLRSDGKGTIIGVKLHLKLTKNQMKDLAEGLKLERMSAPEVLHPVLESMWNADAPTPQAIGKTSDLFTLRGSRLSFSKADERLGVFFFDAAERETRVTSYNRTGFRLVSGKLPNLAPGSYTVEVRTLSRSGKVFVTARRLQFTMEG